VEVVVPRVHYRAELPPGTVDIYFESENSKIDLNAATPEFLTNFFTLWTGDRVQAELITAAIGDWRDADSEVRPDGAEKPAYTGFRFAPRNSALGIADATFVRGLTPGDFVMGYLPNGNQSGLREGLSAFVTTMGGGGAINPNFAPDLVLRSVPGLTETQVERIRQQRKERFFADNNDLQARIGLLPDSPVWRYLTVNRTGPSIRTIARLKSSELTRSERRVGYSFLGFDAATGTYETKSTIGKIERDVFGDPF